MKKTVQKAAAKRNVVKKSAQPVTRTRTRSSAKKTIVEKPWANTYGIGKGILPPMTDEMLDRLMAPLDEEELKLWYGE
jgi:hypothetical protein